jgi:TetR/AcrR family acrAB operon transcriptional repressor
MLRRDKRVIGNYLRKRDNIFTQMLSGVNTIAFFQEMQAAGAIRQDIDAAVIEHIVEMISYGQLTIGDFKPAEQSPPYDAVMEALADMMDRALQPEDGGPGTDASQAGKAIVQQITAAARAQMEQIKQRTHMKEKLLNGVTHDNR